MIVFASEPLFSGRPFKTENPGYTRSQVIRSIICALVNISSATRRKTVLVIRPHPRETTDDFIDTPFGDCGEMVKVVFSRQGRSMDIIASADLVTGMTTILLMEACYLGCIVASIQPGLSQPDTLPSNRLGYSIPIYKQEDIIPILQTLLLNEGERDRIRKRCLSLIPTTKAADRVAWELYALCGIQQEDNNHA
jgi:hypothetical protein